jgi:cobaltochelatase CobS
MNNFNLNIKNIPHQLKSARTLFNIDCDWQVPVLENNGAHVPAIDPNYHFDDGVTKAILAGFLYGKKVLLQGLHGTGKSTHIEQVAARLNWSLLRINLDGHISRYDLIGRDVITLRSGQQVTEFQEGMLPWAMGQVCALLFDEYDAARPDVMFVLQSVLEASGKLTLLDQNKVIEPHAGFRIFATANTLGMGDTTGLYHGTNMINQGQMDRWDIICKLDFLKAEIEAKIVSNYAPSMDKRLVAQMVQMANLTRSSFVNGDLSLMISPRSVIHWAENYEIFGNLEQSFAYAYLNKCDSADYQLIAELYQRVFGVELEKMAAA